ncbi:phage tail protein I [Serratia marcescens]|uniref:phage tail protein I n=1 Tax=Serratia marcescens TaxID=615 RepID=UPI000745448B|nr:phage tail protein I [Serratia marcescens]CUY05452.1 Bacteriophage P2-related tail formation protein [Serratia marcescens]CUY64470.1 Bacteriophage P2-related tail formation protein [Serratia marcescens]CUY69539.1 Bacteriophage P2-related tail formation protein [Serratia marcescens]CUY99231.1 Bacteriophage P2-related tail formation protein [Serratia marcescens]CVA48439.1 Bacteriophage P2-related tail formation protein [Serratia marcescens]
MNSLLPPGSSALERRAAESCAAVSDLNVPLRDLWNPDKCPIVFLPYLAWAFSVDRWDEKWTAAEKRKIVKDAFYIHRRKGTVAAIKRVIENMGYTMTIAEWWEVADPAGTFRLTIDVLDVGITEEIVNELERLIGDAKPVSRHIAGLNIKTVTRGKIYSAVASYCGEILTVYPAGKTPDIPLYYDGKIKHSGHYVYTGNASDE